MKIRSILESEQTSFDVSKKRLKSLNIIKKKLQWPDQIFGDFHCYSNQLTSLEGSPKSVGGDFYCQSNQLTSLEGAPQSVGGSFYCRYNRMISLEGAPRTVGAHFTCGSNQIISLKGAPFSVGKNFSCDDNRLTSLEGSPQSVGGDFDCEDNEIESLSDIHSHIKQINGRFFCRNNPIKHSVLGLLKIQGLSEIVCDSEWAQIINKHLLEKDLIACKKELISANLQEFARL